ncbi:hypothetical protein MY1884_000014 [Beauveria asiatica]
MQGDGSRVARLKKAFRDFLHGTRSVAATRDAELFLEALRAQPSSSVCLELVLGSPSGLAAVHKSVRASSNLGFICSQVLPFVRFLSQPEAKAICEGNLLVQIIHALVSPPTAWNAMLGHYVAGGFGQEEVEIFAWLCSEIVMQPTAEFAPIAAEIEATLQNQSFTSHTSSKVRELGYRIQKIFQMRASSGTTDTEDLDGPGGRHDNDFADFRKISIYPTRDEISSSMQPFYRRADEVAKSDPAERAGTHLDNQFRLLREDMLAELREDLQNALGQKKMRRRVHILGDLVPVGIDTGDDRRGRLCNLRVRVGFGLEQLANFTAGQRKIFLKNNPGLLRHQSFGAIRCDHDIIGFALVVRNNDDLVRDPPVFGLQFCSPHVMTKVINMLPKARSLEFLALDTPIFAYEPVLSRLKNLIELPLETQLLHCYNNVVDEHYAPAKLLENLVQKIRASSAGGKVLRLGDDEFSLDEAQADALASIMERSLAIIQGPPGTGKSYVGAIAAKLLLQVPRARILVLSYTNHALDQFLEDLLKIGIEQDQMTRLGSKSSTATACLSFETQSREAGSRLTKAQNTLFFRLRQELNGLRTCIREQFDKVDFDPSYRELLDYLEFSDNVQLQLFWRAFQIPEEEDGFQMAGPNGSVMDSDDLFERWCKGKEPGAIENHIPSECMHIWALPMDQRILWRDQWAAAILEEHLEALDGHMTRSDDIQRRIETIYNESRPKYSSLVEAAQPDFILVEEAGEILEAHILAALSPSTKGLILIGDHKQLRPKCKNYSLSVEKGSGFDLNRSMFERLVLQGYHHSTLLRQHRMHPDISVLVRSMTYPDLSDGEKTLSRPAIRGMRDRVAFVNHSHPEGDIGDRGDRFDTDQKTSKQNRFEAEMILKTVKYLGQQGYKTENMVVLTPYLGQLRLLQEMLSRENDPLLNDLDSHELIRAGLLTVAAGKTTRGRLRLSTIDNYQGEESDIVIASLTRSNNRGDIGFMKSPERLNVLLSRARDAIIMFGNMETFLASSQGELCWIPFFNLMRKHDYLQDGLHVYCEQHPERSAVLSVPDDFDLKCPDGGCSEICGAALGCGQHTCQRRCHSIVDHSKVKCDQDLEKKCEKQHSYQVKCGESHARCRHCLQEEADMARRAKRDLEMEKDRQARQAAYRQELSIIQDEIESLKRQNKYLQEEESQSRTMQQLREDLAALKETKERQESMEKSRRALTLQNDKSAAPTQTTSDIAPDSAHYEWERMKRDEHASNAELDALMSMIGLESVKMSFLDIKSRVDTALRQGVSTENERFGCSLLGNPGTGKTTVARIYAKFLTRLGVIAGSCFKEVTGAKLANMGVAGCQKLVDNVLDAGGGVIFIDEAYQLSSGNSPGGLAVLDFLLAEVENLGSKVCFVLAGYNKQMESFFAHNPGIPSRFPLEMKFDDYTDDELLQILELKINSKYGHRMKAEDGLRGLYCRIVARRLGRGRDKDGFGNARAVENLLGTVYRRQSDRLRRQRREDPRPDDLLLTKDDLLGPEPSNALLKSAAWAKLQHLIGLKSVKESIKSLVDSAKTNYQRELNEEPMIEYSLNRIFLGNPGTGKTTVAKLYGQVLVDIGLLSMGEVVVKNPSDFVGAVLGESEKLTNGILASTVGKVLVIDEAYGLSDGGASQGGSSSNPFKSAVVDTIVATVHSTVGDDRCVLLLGYRDQMEEMLQNVNPGLSRRFPLSSAFTFEDFSQPELSSILDLKLENQGFGATPKAKQVVLEMLDRARNRPNFGNAGEVDILLNEAKSRHQKRLTAGMTARTSTLEALDFDENYERHERAETNVEQLFNDTIGCERLVATLQGYQETARTTKALGLDPKEQIPFTFLFRGPPGTGKSTTARKMGKVFYDAGFLSDATVHDCSASDLVGQYVGQTGPKVRQLLDKALGAVLLIDEAYRLREGDFAKEALDELVDAITKDRYRKRLIIILAGYEHDINGLLAVNPGLTSRFPEVIDFRSLDSIECFDLLAKKLIKKKTDLEANGSAHMHVDCLEQPSAEFQADVYALFECLSAQASWGNARDIETLANAVFQAAMKAASKLEKVMLTVSETFVRAELEKMANERQSRSSVPAEKSTGGMADGVSQLYPAAQHRLPPQSPLDPARASFTAQQSKLAPSQDIPDESAPNEPMTPMLSADTDGNHGRVAIRDVGVSDEIWEQLQLDAQAEQQREVEYQAKLRAKNEAADEALRERIVKALIEEEERRQREAEMKKKLEMEGRCPVGYHWIRQEGGWRCAGGSHFVSEMELKN